MRKTSFPPVVDADTRLLILGSLPGDASLAAAQYYAHPRNQFWRLLSAIGAVELTTLPYPQRLAALQVLGIGLWDVVASARRRGSLDSDIRDVAFNPLTELLSTLPALQAVAFNGKTAAKAAPTLAASGLDILLLPSSSPALTTPFEKKLAEWQVLGRYILQ
ncbi:DNA-deoxyinosine glycosylase [Vogesella indigofera]|uniref:DNA-deoxyinosine glycosylase n=1 Tax=Vogesella indigofera TaxID=45465 RepID=UPI00234E7DD3|nr:DNA-deoxyinosine glycosylase [Vogesella indigofera]MDC7707279.1 DNA-deoxyinosine glycosylase [Vogesella indigofera]